MHADQAAALLQFIYIVHVREHVRDDREYASVRDDINTIQTIPVMNMLGNYLTLITVK